MNKELIVANIVGSRGIQVQRKDKDLMDGTGGISKGRDREPHLKPGRDDLKNLYRTKDRPSQERDTDTDKDKDSGSDKDLKLSCFFNIPAPTYSDRVASELTNILQNERGVSEKAFSAFDGLMVESRGIVGDNSDIIAQFELNGSRPQLCAEVLYGYSLVKGDCKNNLINSSMGREASHASLANSFLSRFPQTLKALVQKVG